MQHQSQLVPFGAKPLNVKQMVERFVKRPGFVTHAQRRCSWVVIKGQIKDQQCFKGSKWGKTPTR